jgi:pimeloyl-ACP methyl ester carboxylesterase
MRRSWSKPIRMQTLDPRSTMLAVMLAVAPACAGSTGRAESEALDPTKTPGNWEHQHVSIPTANGSLRMHYLAAGPKDAPRVILLHGFPDFSYTWREIIPLLAEDHRVLAPDLRGYAGSDKPATGYDLDTLAADVLGFADATAAIDGVAQDTPTHLIGHDWGAAVGWWTVIRAPSRMASFTAIDVPHPVAFADFLATSDEQRKKSRYMKRLTSPLAPRVFAGMSDAKRRGVYRDELTRKEAFGDAELAWDRAAFDSTEETRPPLAYYEAKFDNARADEAAARKAPKLAIPVLVLWGEKDEYLMSEMAAKSCEHVEAGACQVQIFEGASHWPHWDDPTGVVERWRSFRPGIGPAAEAQASPTQPEPSVTPPAE